MNPCDLPSTLYPRRSQTVLRLLVSLALLSAGVWLILAGRRVGILCVIVFGAGAVRQLLQFSPRHAYLKVTRDGIEYASIFGRRVVPWASIEEFGTLQFGLFSHHRMVGYALREPAPGLSLRAVEKAIFGFDATLPDNFGHSADELAEMLARLHEEYVAAEGSEGRSGNAAASSGDESTADELLKDDETHPIPSVSTLDVFAAKRSGGGRLALIVASPLGADERSQRRLMAKLETYLGFINSVDFRAEAGSPSTDNTEITVKLHRESDPAITTVLERCVDWAADNHARLFVEQI